MQYFQTVGSLESMVFLFTLSFLLGKKVKIKKYIVKTTGKYSKIVSVKTITEKKR